MEYLDIIDVITGSEEDVLSFKYNETFLKENTDVEDFLKRFSPFVNATYNSPFDTSSEITNESNKSYSTKKVPIFSDSSDSEEDNVVLDIKGDDEENIVEVDSESDTELEVIGENIVEEKEDIIEEDIKKEKRKKDITSKYKELNDAVNRFKNILQ